VGGGFHPVVEREVGHRRQCQATGDEWQSPVLVGEPPEENETVVVPSTKATAMQMLEVKKSMCITLCRKYSA
jgi:hypothetical protein